MISTIINLQEVSNQFQLWRDKQNSKFSPIPIYLRDQARQLLKSYSASQVSAALNISRSTLYSIKKVKALSLSNNNLSGSQTLNFIPVNLAELHLPQKSQQINLTCEIIKPNGMKLIIHTSDPTNIINTFLCSN